MSDDAVARSSGSGKAAGGRKPLPQWKKALLGIAILLVVAGVGLKIYSVATGSEAHEPAGRKVSSDLRTSAERKGAGPERPGNSLVDEVEWFPGAGSKPGAAGDSSASGEAAGNLAPGLMKGGFGFIIGFCVGFAVRKFIRISAFVLGMAVLLILGLSYTGVIPPINWASLEGHFNSIIASLKDQASGFKTFIEGNLPSAGLAAAGVATGLKKN